MLVFSESTTDIESTEPIIDIVDNINWSAVWQAILKWCRSTGIRLVIAIVLMIVLFKIINLIAKKFYNRFKKKDVDETFSRVFTQTVKIVLKSLVLICLVSYVGIETASISAVIASLGVGISLAVQGTLSNFAGGMIIIVMRPFKIGDYISSNGVAGTVEDIKMFYTHITTPDNKAIMIPNGSLANNVIVNNSAKDTRRCDIVMPVSYDANIDLVKNLIMKVCSDNELIFKDPVPFIEIGEYADSSINIYVRVWCKNGDYWPVNYYLLREIKKAFDENGIVIPFNQLDVTLKSEN